MLSMILGVSISLLAQNPGDATDPPIPPLLASAFGLLSQYAEKPDPDQAGVLLERILKEHALNDPAVRARPDRFILLAHGFGHVARGSEERVRLYERLFARPDNQAIDRRFMLATLAVCADDKTQASLRNWLEDRKFAAVRPEIEEIETALAAGELRPPRSRAATQPIDLDLLWMDYYVTGQYEPIERILDTLDEPDRLRVRIRETLSQKPTLRGPLFQALKQLDMTDPETDDGLSPLDLDYLLGRNRTTVTPEFQENARKLNELLQLSRADWTGFALKGAAAWSMASNVQQRARLASLLDEHRASRPARSQAHIEVWLEERSRTAAGAAR